MKFNTIEEALEDIKKGKMVILVDDEDRENEGDLTMAARRSRRRPSTSWPSTAGGSSVFRSRPSASSISSCR